MKLQRLILGIVFVGISSFFVWSWLRPSPETNQPVHIQPAEKSSQTAVAQNSANGKPSEVALEKAVEAEPQPTPFIRGLQSAVKGINAESDSIKRDALMKSFANDLPADQLPAALDFLKSQNSSETGRNLTVRLLHRWAGDDSRSAANWASANLSDLFRQEAMNDVAAVWANRDFSSAADWARQLSGEADRASTLTAIAYEAGRTNPVAALHLSTEIPANPGRNDLVAHLVSQWASSEPEKAEEWASQISDVKLRERVTAQIATAWSEENPLAAATLAIKALPPGRQQDDAVVGIVQQWAQTNPTEAADWIVKFPAGDLQNTASSELVKLWADQNAEQAGEWIKGLAPGSARDVMVETYAGKLAPQFPKLAVQWAGEIADETTRQRGMESIAEIWLSNDAAAAKNWIAQSPLSEAAKNRLLNPK